MKGLPYVLPTRSSHSTMAFALKTRESFKHKKTDNVKTEKTVEECFTAMRQGSLMTCYSEVCISCVTVIAIACLNFNYSAVPLF